MASRPRRAWVPSGWAARTVAACRKVASTFLRHAISIGWAIVPAGDRAVVYGGHQLDANAIAVLRALPRWGHPAPVLLVHDVPAVRLRLTDLEDDDLSAVELAHVSSPRGLVRLVRGRLFLYTHFVYGGPRPRGGGRLVVNLWHGDGPKSPLPEGERQRHAASHVLISSNHAWGAVTAEAFALPPDRLWVTGNPRVDEMSRPTSDTALRRLGLDPEVPILLWAPTFRTAEHRGVRGWVDSADADPFRELWSVDNPLRALAESRRLQVVAKPHPFDSTDFRAAGIRVVTDAELAAVGTHLYRFMGRCSALMTDYSSIWTDYAPLDRPIVLYCPDVRSYTEGRGFAGVPFREAAPGPVVETAAELHDVLTRVADHGDIGQEDRHKVCQRLGVELRTGATDRLLELVRTHVPCRR